MAASLEEQIKQAIETEVAGYREAVTAKVKAAVDALHSAAGGAVAGAQTSTTSIKLDAQAKVDQVTAVAKADVAAAQSWVQKNKVALILAAIAVAALAVVLFGHVPVAR